MSNLVFAKIHFLLRLVPMRNRSLFLTHFDINGATMTRHTTPVNMLVHILPTICFLILTCNASQGDEASVLGDKFSLKNLVQDQHDQERFKRSLLTGDAGPLGENLLEMIEHRLQGLSYSEQCSLVTGLLEYISTMRATICHKSVSGSALIQGHGNNLGWLSSHQLSPVSHVLPTSLFHKLAPPPPPPQVIVSLGVIFIPGLGNVNYKLYIFGELKTHVSGEMQLHPVYPSDLLLRAIIHIPSLDFWSRPFDISGLISGSAFQVNMSRLLVLITRLLRVQLGHRFGYMWRTVVQRPIVQATGININSNHLIANGFNPAVLGGGIVSGGIGSVASFSGLGTSTGSGFHSGPLVAGGGSDIFHGGQVSSLGGGSDLPFHTSHIGGGGGGGSDIFHSNQINSMGGGSGLENLLVHSAGSSSAMGEGGGMSIAEGGTGGIVLPNFLGARAGASQPQTVILPAK